MPIPTSDEVTTAVRDAQRLEALRATGLLDTPPEEAFDRLTRLASRFLGVRIACISLIDADRQFFKSQVGLPDPLAARREASLGDSLCRYVVATGEVLAVHDVGALEPSAPDAETHVALGGAAYLGVPIVLAERTIGVFCVVDADSRRWSDGETDTLVSLTALAVTELRRRAEHAARVRAETLLEQGSDGFLVADEQGRCVWANASACRMLGYSREELLRLDLVALDPKEDAVTPLRFDVLRAGKWLVCERRLRRRDGSLIAAEVSATILEDGSLQATFHDVTERVRHEEALRRNESRLRAALAAAAMGDWQWEIATGAVSWSPAVEAMHGMAEGSFGGTFEAYHQAIHPADRSRVLKAIRRAVEERTPHFVEYRIARRDGAMRWLNERGQVLCDDAGRPLRMVGVCVDVTDRKVEEEERERLLEHERERRAEAERELRAQAEWTRDSLAEAEQLGQAPAGVEGAHDANPAGYDAQPASASASVSGETGESSLGRASLAIIATTPEQSVRFWNAAAERLLGWSAAEILGSRSPLTSDERREEHQVLWDAARRGRPLAGIDTKVRRKDGSEVDVTLALGTLEGEGDAGGFVLILADGAERRRVEDQLRQGQKMEAVGRLAGGVAHDLNNLLTAIQGYGDMLLEELDPDGPLHGDAAEIRRAALRAATITQQLLAFSRMQVHQPQVIELNPLIERLAPTLHPELGGGIEVHTRLDPELGRVRADPAQLEQVVRALASNAGEAMAAARHNGANGNAVGTLVLETANESLDGTFARLKTAVASGEYVTLTVRDTGCGMDAATRARCLDPFFTTRERGRGLGLSTVYGIVKQSGGYIWVDSEPGKGTAVRISLPRVNEPLPGSGAEKPPSAALGGLETILVVEEDSAVRALVRKVLTKHGYTVLEAATGADAIALCHEEATPIQLVVVDLTLSDMEGPELVEQLTSVRPSARVLYTSSHADYDPVRRGAVDAERSFLQKPFTAIALTRKVREALDARTGRG